MEILLEQYGLHPLSFTLSITSIILITLVALYVLLTKLNLHYEKNGIKLYSKKEAKVIGERYLLVNQIIAKRKERQYYIIHKGILSEQMKQAEVLLSDYVKIAKQVFLKFIRNFEVPYDEEEVEIQRYSELLKITEYEIKNELRRSFLENHYIEKTPEEFHNYKEKQLEKIFSIVSDYINFTYKPRFFPIETIRNEQKNNLYSYSKILDKIYDNALEIVKKYHSEIRKLEDLNNKNVQQYVKGEEITDCEDYSLVGCYEG